MRLIDADALETTILRDTSWWDNSDEDIAYEAVRDAPTIDAAPVVHAYWIEKHSDYSLGSMMYHDDWLVCSACGRKETELNERDETKETLLYCHCGARMDADHA